MSSFRAKARAVDLLGKGQIADLPTAICELWKNGYDAYGDDLSCDLYLKNYKGLKKPVFTISDDGTGMSKTDLEEKWLVLGTDSRIRSTKSPSKDERLGKPLRIPMGEKGIGRLSVAYLGPIMLLLTKKRNEECHSLFMYWDILDNYNLYLNEVNIPIKKISSIKEVKNVFRDTIKEFRSNISQGDWRGYKPLSEKISTELNDVEIPDFLIDNKLKDFFKPDRHGTIFVIFDPHYQLLELARGGERIDYDKKDYAIQYLRSSLSGISNAFKEEKESFKTSFFIHDSKGKYNFISKQNFFERDDFFNSSDHYVIGRFDENGFFTGKIRVFDQTVEYNYRPIRPPGSAPYGPFKIEFAFVEGEPDNSKLPREKWDLISKKLEIFGGIYIYRDKFRVHPYGRPEYDWLRLEERRTLRAGDYFFSYRRIFGYIEISRKENTDLIDKAGREGFIVNKAFREFQKDLIGFFIDLAKKYFKTSKREETLRQKLVKEVQERNEKVLKAEKKKTKLGKTKFNKELKEKSERIETAISELNELFDKLNVENKKAELIFGEIEHLLSEIEDKKFELNDLKIEMPKRYQLTDRQVNKYHEYLEKHEEALEISEKCEELISNMRDKFSKDNLRKDFEDRYKKFSDDIVTTLREYESRFDGATDDLHQQIVEDIDKFKNAFEKETEEIRLDGTEEAQEVKSCIKTMENIRNAIKEKIVEKYDSFVRHIEDLSFEIDDDLLVGWYKEQYEKIKEKFDAIHELAQLGMAIEIIDHQFNVLYAEMSEAIDYFKDLSKENKQMMENYVQLRNAFEHLENNHRLLTPLYRTMRRTKTKIKGREIKKYLQTFFAKRFERHHINLSTDKSFDNYEFYTYESVIKPVFINIVNNALYWLIPSEERKIHITYENGKILIMNSGEKIEPADLENIFKMFFSKKPDGRGIGLYLAITNLHTIGYEIYATNDKKFNRLGGACFVIKKSGEVNNGLRDSGE